MSNKSDDIVQKNYQIFVVICLIPNKKEFSIVYRELV